MLRLFPFLKRLHLDSFLERVLDGIAPLGLFKTGLPLGVYTALAWVFSTLQVYLLLLVFYANPSVETTLLITVLTALAVALPAVPGNVGPFEAAVILALNSVWQSVASDPSEVSRGLSHLQHFSTLS